MLQNVVNEMLKEKPLLNLDNDVEHYCYDDFKVGKLDKITVHGRFQPPLHINHFYNYISNAFKIANNVTILITNPFFNESSSVESNHRNLNDANIFTFDERVEIFDYFFQQIGISKNRYNIIPFNITDKSTWDDVLDKGVYNMVNAHSDWSYKKLENFKQEGFKVIYSNHSELVDVSGTKMRSILVNDLENDLKKKQLLDLGIMPFAVDKVLEIYQRKN